MPYNATPRFVTLGTHDLSGRTPTRQIEQRPQHLPLYMLLLQRGRTNATMLSSDGFKSKHGVDSLKPYSQYANHQSLAASLHFGQGGAAIVQRLKPANAKTAMLRLSLEVIPTLMPVYDRSSDGSIKIINGAPVVLSEVIGTRLVWHKGISTYPTVQQAFGEALVNESFRVGSITSGLSATDYLGCIPTGPTTKYHPTSTLYPIMDLPADNFGEWGNAAGICITTPTALSPNPTDLSLIDTLKAFIYRFQCMLKDSATSTPTVVNTALNENTWEGVIKSNTRNPTSRAKISLGDSFIPAYQELNRQGFLPLYGIFEKVHVYSDNLNTVLGKLVAGYTDSTHVVRGEAFFDTQASSYGRTASTSFTGHTDRNHLLNIFTGVDQYGVPYFSMDVDNSTLFGGITFKGGAVHYAEGGSDGLVADPNGYPDQLANLQIYDDLVGYELRNFGSLENKYLDTARFPMSNIWDSGFAMSTKEAIAVPLSLRPDIWILASTQSIADKVVTVTDPGTGPVQTVTWALTPTNTASVDLSTALSLRSLYALSPESVTFGTPACRAVIVARNGIMLDSVWEGRFPASMDLVAKVADYAGASNGKWKSGKQFDENPQNIISTMGDISVGWQPANAQDRQWAAGMIVPQSFDMSSDFFPAFQTVYPDDTSVLNSLPVIMAICEATRVANGVWRVLVGNTTLSSAAFLQESDRLITSGLEGRFAGRFTFKAETTMTAADNERGYSWSTKVVMYANNMRTYNEFHIEARRMSDLNAQ